MTRSAVIQAPPEKVFPVVNNFHQWEQWSPWAKMDPQSKTTYSGPESGVGAKFAWDGNSSVGAGSMEITESKPNERIQIALIFTKPMEGNNRTLFQFEPVAEGTRVTWMMSGPMGFVGKFFNLFMNCEKMVGGQFEQGMENMKGVVAGLKKP